MKKLWVIWALAAFVLQSCVVVYAPFNLWPEVKPLEEVTLEGSGSPRIAMIDINGEIMNEMEQGLFGMSLKESQVSLLHDQLKMISENKNVRAILLRVNSPGGSVTASDLLYRQLKSFREKSQIPMYVMMMDVAASGGYYISMAADQIYATPTTVTGSIGVIMLNLSFEGLMKKIGVASKVVKSGENKDIGSPFKDFTPEERKILQSVIDDLYTRFVDVVASGRPKLQRETIKKLADGRVYTAEQAKNNGLIDGITYLPELIEQIKHDQKLEKARVITYRHGHESAASNIYSQVPKRVMPQLNLVDPHITERLSKHLGGAGFYYLWDPGHL